MLPRSYQTADCADWGTVMAFILPAGHPAGDGGRAGQEDFQSRRCELPCVV
jgi:hypothetical protein